MKNIKRIGVLTSGGDCPGLNAALRAIVNRAHYQYGWEIYGIYDAGYSLYTDKVEYRKLEPKDFCFYESRIAGSILRCLIRKFNPFPHDIVDGSNKDLKGSDKDYTPIFKENIKKLGLDGLIITGGDGSMGIFNRLCKHCEIPFIGIPKTIDNDTPLTAMSIGFSSAVDICVNAMDDLITNAYSHNRWIILQVMGRHVGHIALRSGIAGAADAILIPEIPYTIDGLVAKIKQVEKAEGRQYGIIVAAEGESNSDMGKVIAEKLSAYGITARDTVVGHMQRGGTPNGYDRRLATMFGVRAVDMMASGKEYKMIGYTDGKLKEFDLEDVVKARTAKIDKDSDDVKIAKDMGIYIGEI